MAAAVECVGGGEFTTAMQAWFMPRCAAAKSFEALIKTLIIIHVIQFGEKLKKIAIIEKFYRVTVTCAESNLQDVLKNTAQ